MLGGAVQQLRLGAGAGSGTRALEPYRDSDWLSFEINRPAFVWNCIKILFSCCLMQIQRDLHD